MKILGLGIPELTALGSILVVPLVVAVVCAVANYQLATRKGYHRVGFAAMGFLLNVVGLAIALAVPDKNMLRPPTPAEELMRYQQLLERGAVTPEEFAAKKSELLSR